MVWSRGTRWFAVSLLASGVGLGGCQGPTPLPVGGPPDFPAMLNMPGTGGGELLSRAQKQDGPPGSSRGMLELRPGDPGNHDTRGARIRAVVNGEAILDEEVVAAAYQGLLTVHNGAERAELLNQKLNELIDREVILQDASAKLSKGPGGDRFLKELKRIASQQFDKQWLHKLMRANKYTDVEKFKQFLRANGMPLDMIRRQWERNFIAMEYLRTRTEPNLNRVGHLQIAEYYSRHTNDFQVEDEITWQDLFIAAGASRENARQLANVLMNRIRAGEDFVGLAKAHDNGDSSLRENSEGIGHKRGEIRPQQVEETLFRLKQGEMALVEMEPGFRIVRVVKRQYAGIRPFDEKVQKEIKEKLRGDIFQQEMKRIVNELRRHSIIEVANEIN